MGPCLTLKASCSLSLRIAVLMVIFLNESAVKHAPSEYVHQRNWVFLLQWLLSSIDHLCVAKQCFPRHLQDWYISHSRANFKSVRSQRSLLRGQIKVICWERFFISKFITFQAHTLRHCSESLTTSQIVPMTQIKGRYPY